MRGSSTKKQSSLIKTEEEIALMREAGKIVAETIALVAAHAKPGVTTLELDALAEDFIRAQGAEPAFKGYRVGKQTFKYTLCTSVDNQVVHGLPTSQPLREGQILSIDTGAKKNGYYGDSAFTVAIGIIPGEWQRLMSVTTEALAKGIDEAREGKKVFDIAKAVQQHCEAAGFGVVRDLVGHGIGRELHEPPQIPNFVPNRFERQYYDDMELRAGMTIAIEPMVNLGTHRVHTGRDGWTIETSDGKPSAHFEHTILIKSGGAPAEILTTL